MEERTRHVAAAAALVAAIPVATWTLVGDLSSGGFDEAELDYVVRAPDIPSPVELVAGAVAVTVVLASAWILALAVYRGHLRRPWLATVVPLCVAGVVLGFVGRAVTAGGIGANIGGGLAILFGVPFVAVLVIAAAVNAWVELRRP